MKVKELIDSLSCFNPDADVGIKTIDDEYIDHLYVSYICRDVNNNELTEKQTKRVWIEAIDLCSNCQFFGDNYCSAYDKDASEVDECYQFVEIE